MLHVIWSIYLYDITLLSGFTKVALTRLFEISSLLEGTVFDIFIGSLDIVSSLNCVVFAIV